MPTSPQPGKRISRTERAVWQAAIAALLVHVLALGILERWGRLPAPEAQPYAQVDFVTSKRWKPARWKRRSAIGWRPG